MGAERHRQRKMNRKVEAWNLRVQGWTQSRIAARLNISQQAVSLLLREAEGELAAAFTDHVFALRCRQTEQIEALIESMGEQWLRSCGELERRTVVRGRVAASPQHGVIDLPDLETIVREGQSGNPALAQAILKAYADIRAIWGADAPQRQRQDITSGGEPFKVYCGFDPESV